MARREEEGRHPAAATSRDMLGVIEESVGDAASKGARDVNEDAAGPEWVTQAAIIELEGEEEENFRRHTFGGEYTDNRGSNRLSHRDCTSPGGSDDGINLRTFGEEDDRDLLGRADDFPDDFSAEPMLVQDAMERINKRECFVFELARVSYGEHKHSGFIAPTSGHPAAASSATVLQRWAAEKAANDSRSVKTKLRKPLVDEAEKQRDPQRNSFAAEAGWKEDDYTSAAQDSRDTPKFKTFDCFEDTELSMDHKLLLELDGRIPLNKLGSFSMGLERPPSMMNGYKTLSSFDDCLDRSDFGLPLSRQLDEKELDSGHGAWNRSEPGYLFTEDAGLERNVLREAFPSKAEHSVAPLAERIERVSLQRPLPARSSGQRRSEASAKTSSTNRSSPPKTNAPLSSSGTSQPAPNYKQQQPQQQPQGAQQQQQQQLDPAMLAAMVVKVAMMQGDKRGLAAAGQLWPAQAVAGTAGQQRTAGACPPPAAASSAAPVAVPTIPPKPAVVQRPPKPDAIPRPERPVFVRLLDEFCEKALAKEASTGPPLAASAH